MGRSCPRTSRSTPSPLPPTGTALALGWGSGMASIWEVPAGADAATLVVEYPAARVDAAAFSPDGSLILSGSRSDGSVLVEVRDAATGALIAAPKGHRGQVETVAFSRDGSTFATNSHDGTILVWDLRLILPHPQTLAGLSARRSGRTAQRRPGRALCRGGDGSERRSFRRRRGHLYCHQRRRDGLGGDGHERCPRPRRPRP